jgi:hypothetical protein
LEVTWVAPSAGLRLQIGQTALVVILRYETEARELVNTVERASEVRTLRVDRQGTWRFVGEECQQSWGTTVGQGDTQSLGATLCHVAAELLAEDPDADPWN